MLLIRLSAMAGFVGPLMFISVAIFAGSKDPEFSHITDWMSELGATGAPYADLFNHFGLIPLGVCLMVFAPAFLKIFGPGARASVSAVLLMLVGLIYIFLAIFNCDYQCGTEMMTLNAQIHNWLAIFGFPIIVLTPAIIGMRAFHTRENKGYYQFCLVSAILLLIAYILLLIIVAEFWGKGLLQSGFIIVFVYWNWVTVRQVWSGLAKPKD